MEDKKLNVIEPEKTFEYQEEKFLMYIEPDKNMKLTTRAKKIYKSVFEVLNNNKRIAETDIPMICMYAQALDTYATAQELIMIKEKEEPGSGYIQKFKNGASNFATEYLLRRDAEKSIHTYSKKFGLTIRDKKEISSMISDSKQLDMYAALFGQSKLNAKD